jgi:hypothetical protein
MKRPDNSLSRREFAKRAALGTAAAIAPVPLSPLATRLPAVAGHSFIPSDSEGPLPQQSPEAAKLSPQSQAEADSRLQSILAQYPDRFSEAQKTDLKRLCFVTQQSLDSLRAYAVSNNDQPALYLKPLVEREKKTNAPPNLRLAPSPGDKAVPTPPTTKPSTDKP